MWGALAPAVLTQPNDNDAGARAERKKLLDMLLTMMKESALRNRGSALEGGALDRYCAVVRDAGVVLATQMMEALSGDYWKYRGLEQQHGRADHGLVKQKKGMAKARIWQLNAALQDLSDMLLQEVTEEREQQVLQAALMQHVLSSWAPLAAAYSDMMTKMEQQDPSLDARLPRVLCTGKAYEEALKNMPMALRKFWVEQQHVQHRRTLDQLRAMLKDQGSRIEQLERQLQPAADVATAAVADLLDGAPHKAADATASESPACQVEDSSHGTGAPAATTNGWPDLLAEIAAPQREPSRTRASDSGTQDGAPPMPQQHAAAATWTTARFAQSQDTLQRLSLPFTVAGATPAAPAEAAAAAAVPSAAPQPPPQSPPSAAPPGTRPELQTLSQGAGAPAAPPAYSSLSNPLFSSPAGGQLPAAAPESWTNHPAAVPVAHSTAEWVSFD